MKAKLLKQTEKAIQVMFRVEIGSYQPAITTWLPKSQVEIVKKDNDIIEYNAPEWLIRNKVIEYCNALENKNNEVKALLLKPNSYTYETF